MNNFLLLFRRALYTIIFCSFFISVIAQESDPNFQRLTIEDGLSQSNVECVTQDSDGYLWFGTRDGLNKYDGYKFVVYRNEPGNDSSISGNRIEDIVEDSNGVLWVATHFNGVCSYNKETDNFTQYILRDDDNEGLFSDTRGLYLDADDKLWVFTMEGIGWYNREQDAFEYLTRKEFFGDDCGDLVSSAIDYSEEEILFCTMNCVNFYLYNKRSKEVKAIQMPMNEWFSGAEKFVCSDSKDNIWIGDLGGGLFEYSNNFEALNHFGKYSHSTVNIGSQVRSFAELKNGQYWIGMDSDGLYIIDKDKHSVKHLLSDQNNLFSIAGNTVYDIYEDRTGVVWICHFNNGISYYDPNSMRFNSFINDADNLTSLSPNPVLSVYEDSNGRVWVGTDGGGLNLFNKEDGTFEHFTTKSHGFTTDVITAINEDGRGNLLLGTWGGGFMVFNPETGYLKDYLTSDSNVSLDGVSSHVWSFERDKNGLVWLGILGSSHAYYFDPYTEQVSDYVTLTGKENIIEAQIMSSMKDSDGNIWFGTEGGGVYQYNVDDQQMVVFKSKVGGLVSDVVLTIFEDSKGQIWMGSQNSGISIFNPEDKTFRVLNKDSGLVSDGIMGILEDDNHNMWISTTNGISRYNTESGEFSHFTEKDGLQGREFKYNASIRDSEGLFYFGGLKGLSVFNPNDISKNEVPPLVHFTDFKLFNKSVDFTNDDSPLSKHISSSSSIVLKHNQNIFEISYVGINYTATDKNQYKYKMVGFDEDYILTQDRSASYMNLEPGDYTFHVMASNNDGVWNTKGVSINITVKPPWWRTWLFRISVIILISIAIVLFFRWRTAELRRSQMELQDKVVAATREVEKRNKNLAEAQNKLESIMADVKHDLGGASKQLLEASGSEAASIEEMSANIDQMTNEIKETASGTKQMLNVTKGIEKDTEQVVQIVSDTMNAITDINEGIAFITDFTKKTNLISLNAAIEAARAGEYGRSFAVVAAEVKNLADQSQGIASKITVLSKQGLELSIDANEKIGGLYKYIQNIVSLISQISETSQNQSEQATNINAAIRQLELYVTGTAALAEKLDGAIQSLSLDD